MGLSRLEVLMRELSDKSGIRHNSPSLSIEYGSTAGLDSRGEILQIFEDFSIQTAQWLKARSQKPAVDADVKLIDRLLSD